MFQKREHLVKNIKHFNNNDKISVNEIYILQHFNYSILQK